MRACVGPGEHGGNCMSFKCTSFHSLGGGWPHQCSAAKESCQAGPLDAAAAAQVQAAQLAATIGCRQEGQESRRVTCGWAHACTPSYKLCVGSTSCLLFCTTHLSPHRSARRRRRQWLCVTHPAAAVASLRWTVASRCRQAVRSQQSCTWHGRGVCMRHGCSSCYRQGRRPSHPTTMQPWLKLAWRAQPEGRSAQLRKHRRSEAVRQQ